MSATPPTPPTPPGGGASPPSGGSGGGPKNPGGSSSSNKPGGSSGSSSTPYNPTKSEKMGDSPKGGSRSGQPTRPEKKTQVGSETSKPQSGTSQPSSSSEETSNSATRPSAGGTTKKNSSKETETSTEETLNSKKKQSSSSSGTAAGGNGKDERTRKEVARDAATAAASSSGTGGEKAKSAAAAAASGKIDDAAQKGVEAGAEAAASAVASPVAGRAVAAAFETKTGKKASKAAGKAVKWGVIAAVGVPITIFLLILALVVNVATTTTTAFKALNDSCLDNYQNLGVNVGDQGDMTNQAYVWQQLRAEGLSEEATAGIMGNIEHESGFDPAIENSIGAFGIAQWLGGRRDRLENYAKKNDMNYKTLEAQVAYLIYESKRWESQAWNAVKKASTVSEAAETWMYDWERPFPRGSGEGAAEAAERITAAKKYFNEFRGTDVGSNVPPPSGDDGGGAQPPSGTGIEDLPVSNKAVKPVKVPMVIRTGLFYSGGAPHGGWDVGVGRGTNVYAVKEGIVAAVQDGYPNTGGGTGTPDNHVLLQTKYKGKPVTVEYHHLSPGVKDFVKVGDRVAAGQQVGKSGNSGHSDGDHLHINVVWGATSNSFSQWGETTNPPIVFPPSLVWKGGDNAEYMDGKADGVNVRGPVFIVGDSLTVGSQSEIDNVYEELNIKQTTDAKVSRTIPEGLEVLKTSPAAKKANTWVVALGTNDNVSRKTISKRVQSVLNAAGDRDVYWINVSHPDEEFETRVNDVLVKKAESDKNLTVVDFNGQVAGEYFADDDIHLTPEGYKWRADLYAPKLEIDENAAFDELSQDCREELGVSSGYSTGTLNGDYGNPWTVEDAYRTATWFALGNRGAEWDGLCLGWVNKLYGWEGGYTYAYQVWTNAPSKYRHPGNGKDAPAGAIILWPNESNGGVGGQAGHIAVAVGDGKHMLSTGVGPGGSVGVDKIWPGAYGWMEPWFGGPGTSGVTTSFRKITAKELPDPAQELIDAKLVPPFDPGASLDTKDEDTTKDDKKKKDTKN